MNESGAPSLPLPVLALATLVLLFPLLRAYRGEPTTSGRFLLIVIWLRLIMQAFHPYTYQTVGGLSVNAIVSLGVCGVGLLMYLPRLALVTRLWGALFVCAIIAISGLHNDLLITTVETLLKWGYFFFIFLALVQAIDESRDSSIVRRLIWALAPALVFQILSVGMGIAKSGESDGSASFIGGFNHEAVFSILLVASFFIISVAPRIPFWLRAALLAYCIMGLFLANYRTSILAVLPLVCGYVAFAFPNEFRAGQRTFPWMITIVGALLAVFALGDFASTRMADLQDLVASDVPLIRSPDEFTAGEADIFSGRWHLWNVYIEQYLQGDEIDLLIGSGPDSWESFSFIYAHNTLVSYLYEFGFLGALGVAIFWGQMLLLCARIQSPSLRRQLFFAHVGFIVLNFATMPLWAIEGLIFYGLLCGLTVAATAPKRQARMAPVAPVGVQPAPLPPAREHMR